MVAITNLNVHPVLSSLTCSISAAPASTLPTEPASTSEPAAATLTTGTLTSTLTAGEADSVRREDSSTGLTMVFTWFVPRWRQRPASYVGANGWTTHDVSRVVFAAGQKEYCNKLPLCFSQNDICVNARSYFHF